MIAWHFPNLRSRTAGEILRHAVLLGHRRGGARGGEFPGACQARRGSGTTPGTIRRSPTGSSTARCSTRRSWPRRPAIGSRRDGFTAGRESAAAKAPAPTSGTTPMPSLAFSPTWSAISAAAPISAAAMDPKTGVINHRGEGAGLAVDGQAGCILRAYREHQMSADPAFLKALWPQDQAGHAVPCSHGRGRRAARRARSTTRSISPGSARSPGSVRCMRLPPGPARRWPARSGDAAFARTDAGDLPARQPEHRPRIVQRRVLFPDLRARTLEERRLAQRLRDRPGLRAELGLPGRPGQDPAPKPT